MDSYESSQTLPSVSLAQAKLERQMKRIEQADPTVKVPLPLEREQQGSYDNKKDWKPFDLTTHSMQPQQSHEGGVPLTGILVNTFRTQSRASSLNRSMSSLSQHTTTTGPSEMERQDSALVDPGFQLYTGRRNRKHLEQLSAYEDKPEEKQTTVEASFDKREIYDVFGNALPGPEFIEQNVGYKNGQLQFVQHPNGDVSAHQWSTQRYIWENIGQYSNIRKKIEGQLAADRLKGETAYQTLQQNTLTYFKTVAKQREATSMGLRFGAKDVQAALPVVRPAQAEPLPAVQKKFVAEAEADTLVHQSQTPSVTNDIRVTRPERLTQNVIFNTKGAQSLGAPLGGGVLQATATHPSPELNPYRGGQRYPCVHPVNVPTGPRTSSFSAAFNANVYTSTARHDDPFYTQPTSLYQNIYGGFPFPVQAYNTTQYAPPYDQYGGVREEQQQFSYGAHISGYDSGSVLVANLGVHEVPQPRRGDLEPPRETIHPRYAEAVRSDVASHQSTGDVTIVAPRPKPVTPLSTRTQMRDHLKTLGEQAEERRLSQDKIRTVLYDPFRDQQSAADINSSQPQAEVSPTNTRHASTSHFASPSASEGPSQALLRTVLAPGRCTPNQGVNPTNAAQDHLKDSSPDTYWDKMATDISTPLLASSSPREKPRPQNFQGPFFQALTPPPGSAAKPSRLGRKAYDQELFDWWTSSNRFRRQEEFYQSIKAADKATHPTSSPPAAQAPIGTPATKSSPSSNATTDLTRLLIPIYENLASYVEGPTEKRRDYFCQWSQPPEWCIDRGPNGNNSFYDASWGQPPHRVGRDPRYQPLAVERVRFGGFTSPQSSLAVGSGLDRRFAFGGRL